MLGLIYALRAELGLKEPNLYQKSDKLVEYRWCAKQDIKTVFRYLYPEGEYPRLGRKWRKFQEFLGLCG